MKLVSRDGAEVALQPVRYQFPDIHDEAGQEIPAAGTMIFSVDMTDVTRAMSKRFRALTSCSISHEEFERLQKDALDEIVKVEDC